MKIIAAGVGFDEKGAPLNGGKRTSFIFQKKKKENSQLKHINAGQPYR